MKKTLLAGILFVISFCISAQCDFDEKFIQNDHKKDKSQCGTGVQFSDSSMSFRVDELTGMFTPIQVTYTTYDRNWNLTEVIVKTLPERINVYRQIFEYNDHNNMLLYIYQIWDVDKWTDNLITEKTYDTEGLLATEVFYRENIFGVFTPYQQHFYHYDGDRIASYLRQVKDVNGNWYDFSDHNYVYDTQGRLILLYGQYHNSDLIYWERKTVYDSKGLISERYFRILRYDPVQKMNVLTNELYQTYSYNIFGNVDTVFGHDWVNQAWTLTHKDVAFYSLIPGGKASVCHKGINICISVNAVEAHLKHGDKLGSCPEAESRGEIFKDFEAPGNDKNSRFSLFPNPASNYLTIIPGKDSSDYQSGYLLSSEGTVIYNIQPKNRRDIIIDISNLRRGIYYIRMVSSDGSEVQPFSVVR